MKTRAEVCLRPRLEQGEVLREEGFTLIEMLVVMLILGMLAGTALPAMQRWHDAVQARSEGAALVEAVRAGAFAASARRLSLVLDGDSFDAARAMPGGVMRLKVQLPQGWRVESAEPVTLLASGLCRPGGIVLRSSRGVLMRLAVGGDGCEVSLRPVVA